MGLIDNKGLVGKAASWGTSPLSPFHPSPFPSHKLNQDHKQRCVSFFPGRGGVGKFIMKLSCLSTIYNKFLLEKDIWLTTVFFCLGMTKYSKNSR